MPHEISIPFGKHRYTLLSDVPVDYLRWLLTFKPGDESVAAGFAFSHREAIEAAIASKNAAAAESYGDIEVTSHQQEAVDHLLSRVTEGACVVRLQGGAGYGKSYTTTKLLIELRRLGYDIRAAAVSYVATQVLAQGLDPYGFESATLARTLKLAKVFSEDDGSESYVMTSDTDDALRDLLSDGKALVIDECGMVNDEIGEKLIEAAHSYGGVLILVGDESQLPPVKQDTVSILCQTPDPATLSVPMRYSVDSQLYWVEQTARSNPRMLLPAMINRNDLTEAKLVPGGDDFVREYVNNFRDHPSKTHRVLMFRRTDVVKANNAIRFQLYGPFAEDIEPGERLMILRTSDYPFTRKSDFNDATRYYSGQSFEVKYAQQVSYKVPFAGSVQEIPCREVLFKDQLKPIRVIFAINENVMDNDKLGSMEYQQAISDARNWGRETKNWEPWKQLASDFVWVAYQYATSIHRAQGQTLDYAYVAPGPLASVKGLLGDALQYVAMTRARKQLTVLV